jgi:hypothetical protein
MAHNRVSDLLVEFLDRSLPWRERLAIVRKAVDQLPGDWRRDIVFAFYKEVEPMLLQADGEPRDGALPTPRQSDSVRPQPKPKRKPKPQPDDEMALLAAALRSIDAIGGEVEIKFKVGDLSAQSINGDSAESDPSPAIVGPQAVA